MGERYIGVHYTILLTCVYFLLISKVKTKKKSFWNLDYLINLAFHWNLIFHTYMILSILADLKPRFYFNLLLLPYTYTHRTHTGKLHTELRTVSLFYSQPKSIYPLFPSSNFSHYANLVTSRQMYIFIWREEKHGLEKYLLNPTGEELIGQVFLIAQEKVCTYLKWAVSSMWERSVWWQATHLTWNGTSLHREIKVFFAKDGNDIGCAIPLPSERQNKL